MHGPDIFRCQQPDCPGVVASAAGTQCPRCGSRHFVQFCEAKTSILASIGAKHKRPGVRGYLTELFQGWQPTRAPGGHIIGKVWKLFRIDKSTSPPWIREKVVTDDGIVTRDIDEALSEHRGRGSAKFKN